MQCLNKLKAERSQGNMHKLNIVGDAIMIIILIIIMFRETYVYWLLKQLCSSLSLYLSSIEFYAVLLYEIMRCALGVFPHLLFFFNKIAILYIISLTLHRDRPAMGSQKRMHESLESTSRRNISLLLSFSVFVLLPHRNSLAMRLRISLCVCVMHLAAFIQCYFIGRIQRAFCAKSCFFLFISILFRYVKMCLFLSLSVGFFF